MKDHATAQINLPGQLASVVLAMRNSIPDEDLAGRQDNSTPHITLCWGLLEDDPKAIWEVARMSMPFYVRLGKTKVFPPSESSNHAAVVHVEAISPFLTTLHQRIKEQLATKPSEHSYNPHCTIAFVKPSVAHKYENSIVLDGKDFMATYVNLVDKHGIERTISIHPYRVR